MNAKDRLEALVDRIVADPALHARWLNTFSYLEYVGFRKIVKSQKAEALTAQCSAMLAKRAAMRSGSKS